MILDSLPPGVATVTGVRLFPQADRSADPLVVPVDLIGDDWVIDTLEVPPGRWWPEVSAERTGGAPAIYPHRFVDLPIDDTLVVSPESVASAARISLPLSADDREFVIGQIRSAMADVQAYLNRPLMPIEYVQSGLWDFQGQWRLSAHGNDDGAVRILQVKADAYGDTYTVRYLAGINARDEPDKEPIRRYVREHAMNSPAFTKWWADKTGAKGSIRSAGTQGQSVSYEKATLGGGGAAGSGAPGSLPTLSSLSYWRVINVYQARTRYGAQEPW